jgi:hypothetical protein
MFPFTLQKFCVEASIKTSMERVFGDLGKWKRSLRFEVGPGGEERH